MTSFSVGALGMMMMMMMMMIIMMMRMRMRMRMMLLLFRMFLFLFLFQKFRVSFLTFQVPNQQLPSKNPSRLQPGTRQLVASQLQRPGSGEGLGTGIPRLVASQQKRGEQVSWHQNKSCWFLKHIHLKTKKIFTTKTEHGDCNRVKKYHKSQKITSI